jgi:thiamine biosynthesis lipoprotein
MQRALYILPKSIWLFLIGGFLVGCSTTSTPVLARFTFQQPQMGVPFQIIFYAPDEPSAKAASDAAFARIKQLNDVMSDYDPESELSKLSRTSGSGQAMKVSHDLWIVLNKAQQISQESRGAFDITVGPTVALWRKARREKKFPDLQKLEEARASSGFEKMRLNPKNHSVELLAKNMKLDLGGIAKGYGVDEAMKVLQKYKVRSALVSGGGDMLASEPPPGKPGWKVELSFPDDDAGSIPPEKKFVLLSNEALATSGDTFQFVELDGKRYSHIVDPRTGVGLTNHSVVNVVAKDCMTADALTKTVSVLGPEEGFPLIKKHPGASARMARKVSEKVEHFQMPSFPLLK